MIKSKKELKQYIEADLKALNCYPLTLKMRVGGRLSPSIFRFQIMMRKLEYDANVRGKNGIRKAIFWLKYKRYERYGTKLGFTIPINVFGPGLCLCHIGPGVKLYGKIKIGDDVAIGANAVVNKDVADHVTVAGVPATVISEKGATHPCY
jgi:serine O-acetyltransferase